jgi:hypothetical protein
MNGPASPSSPIMKRKPLTSSFSMLGGLSLATGDGAGGAVATSRPARPFKGSSSSFVRSWEGLPISQVQMRTIAEANAGRDTIFGFQTLGKAVVWTEIGKGKKVRSLSRLSPQPQTHPCCPAGFAEPHHLRQLSDLHRREPAHRVAQPN